ncbi:ERF family DNA pairing protein [Mycobacterium phage Diminimus]|uniref:ERF family ssDNA binding protein n=4 Tax=Bongovirus bongo TaxID=1983750 RepID=A0A514DJ56_9CAUD|nr:Erf-like ssDNA annealing protein [Mycobacterium phage PegLeg]YP_009604912.1 Erf-like ssDNA annealing protein [Mycobacterium phage Bongo]AXQ52695.1 ERF family ssDNA binding protein [Mycobacterium phage IPhane7]QDH93627.1 ERF family ssDNA binding protein [Mycobacterium phage LilhomieP]QUU29254.1 ERF family ssDNA binding protein [Mycobacterium phage SirSheldon]WMI33235.1 ERF family DNA pairing protein [Mycobacterium phage SlimJimmy]WNM75268.1 ERF family DNA pairing protein [Mycobacterium phag
MSTLPDEQILFTSGEQPYAMRIPNGIGPDLAEALVAAQAEFGAVAKDTANPFFKSKYADLPAVKAEAQPVLAKHGLAVTQHPGYVVIDGKVHDTLTTKVVHKSGQADESTMILRPVKADPQAQGSAITYAKRYAFMAVLGLVADEDDDGNAASGRGKAPARNKPAAKGNPNAEGLGNPEVAKAINRVKSAIKKAGKTPKDAQAYFGEQYPNGGSLIASTDVAALTAVAEHFEGLANATSELGGTEVSE